MSKREPAVYKDGRYNGRTLAEWVPDRVHRLVERFDPLKIILFGSLATDDGGPDSDIDLVVVVPKVGDKHRLAVQMRLALSDLPVPNDIIPTDPEENRYRNVEGVGHGRPHPSRADEPSAGSASEVAGVVSELILETLRRQRGGHPAAGVA